MEVKSMLCCFKYKMPPGMLVKIDTQGFCLQVNQCCVSNFHVQCLLGSLYPARQAGYVYHYLCF